MSGAYNLVIVGGGISGASLLYTAATFTGIDSIALVEKESEVAAINSHHTNNSQTLHFGDIETNYTLEKAEEVKEGAEFLAGYLENHDPATQAFWSFRRYSRVADDDATGPTRGGSRGRRAL